ncbi:MAG: zinc ribbon domain-containing protein [Chloroflexi bacterium]|nr:zinc ribbon domain-containing protein [Chloroflexota bacterium]
MPIYTYRCENCGIQFDRQQKFSDQPLARCPECNKKSLHKVYAPVGIVFKGSGFYSTDNRSPSGQNVRSHKESESKTAAKETKSEPAKSKGEKN